MRTFWNFNANTKNLSSESSIQAYKGEILTTFWTFFSFKWKKSCMAFIIFDYPGPGAYDPNKEATLPQVPAYTIPSYRWPRDIPVGPGPQTYNIKRTFSTGPQVTMGRRYPKFFQRQQPRPPKPPTKKVPRVYPPNRIIYGIGMKKYHELEWKIWCYKRALSMVRVPWLSHRNWAV